MNTITEEAFDLPAYVEAIRALRPEVLDSMLEGYRWSRSYGKQYTPEISNLKMWLLEVELEERRM